MSKTFRKNAEIEPETTNKKLATITKEEFMNEKNLVHTPKFIEVTDWTEENVLNLLNVPALCLTCPYIKFDQKGNVSCKAGKTLYDGIHCESYPVIEKLFRQMLFVRGLRGNWDLEIKILTELAQEEGWFKDNDVIKRKIEEAINEAL